MKRGSLRGYLVSLVLLVLVVIIFIMVVNKSDKSVKRVIDGDTFELANGEKVRLICIDAPEKGEQGYEESTEFLEILILNKKVKLEKDTTDKDRYGRLLRYVYVTEDPDILVFVNQEIVKQGYAEVFRVEPDISKCDEIGS